MEELIMKTEYLTRFERHLTEKGSADATIKKYLRDVRTFCGYLGEDKRITRTRLSEYRQWLIGHYAANSVNSMLAALNGFLELLSPGWIRLKRIRIQQASVRSEDRELVKEEYFRLLETARSQGKEELALLLETICSTGIRVGELRFFTVEAVKSGLVQVWNKGKYRLVVLPGELQRKLIDFCRNKERKSGIIFCTRSGRAKDRSNIWKEMKNLAKPSGVIKKKVFPHNLRHLFARSYYHMTKNLVMLADILGHSSLNVTRIYTSDSIGEWRKSIERLDLVLKNGMT